MTKNEKMFHVKHFGDAVTVKLSAVRISFIKDFFKKIISLYYMSAE